MAAIGSESSGHRVEGHYLAFLTDRGWVAGGDEPLTNKQPWTFRKRIGFSSTNKHLAPRDGFADSLMTNKQRASTGEFNL